MVYQRNVRACIAKRLAPLLGSLDTAKALLPVVCGSPDKGIQRQLPVPLQQQLLVQLSSL
jgi:hypothetical protein